MGLLHITLQPLIFDSNGLFVLALSVLTPFFLFLILGWLFTANDKKKTGKLFFYLGFIYILLIVLIPLALILFKE